MIFKAVRGSECGDETHYVHRPRQKLNNESGTLIHTAPDVGYCLQIVLA
jgi:DNA-binding response OmpR family regulator